MPGSMSLVTLLSLVTPGEGTKLTFKLMCLGRPWNIDPLIISNVNSFAKGRFL